MPKASCQVKASPKTKAPTHTAVTGSMAPKMDVSVPPMLCTASTRVMFEMTVGTTASSIRLAADRASGMGWMPLFSEALAAISIVVKTKT